MKTQITNLLSNITGSPLSTILGCIAAAILAGVQYYSQGHVTISQAVIDGMIALYGGLSSTGMKSKVAAVIVQAETIGEEFEPAFEWLVTSFPNGKIKTKIQAAISYATNPEIKILIDKFIAANKTVTSTSTPAIEVKAAV